FGAIILLLGIGQARADLLQGVNLDNPQWQSAGDQDNELAHLKESYVHTIRIPLVAPYAGPISLARRAAEHGLSIVLVITCARPDARRAGIALRPGLGQTWAMQPLSGVDPGRFTAELKAAIDQLAAARVNIAAFELGNEINWTPFNGDFPLPGAGRVMGTAELEQSPEGRRIARGYDNYLELLAGLKRVRDGSGFYRHTPIISAGLADIGEAWTAAKKMDAVTIGATLDYLRQHGLDALVDGYGIHIYPPGQGSDDARFKEIRDALTRCGPDARGKPCWLTEWGYPTDPKACDDTGDRPRVVASTMSFLKRLASGGVLRAALYYEWDKAGDQYAIFRCGHLTKAGHALLGPK
ncbi:MAG TPA: hypothetical protein VGG57_19585, partial [Stellaceae bacterium]